MNSEPDIFVSYASEDRERVRPLVGQLEQNGWRIWWDREIKTGTLFDREIEKAIHGARCILVIWSQASIESDWVRTEANEGLDRNILIPVAIDNVRPPLAYRRVQTNLLLGWPDGGHEEELRRLTAAIHSLLGSRTPFLAAPDEESAGERRHVSIVSGRITEQYGHHDPEKTDELVHQFKEKVAELAQKFGGYVYQSTGSSWVFIFGIPVANEKDTLMAVTLALEARTALGTILARFPWAAKGTFTVESSVTAGLVVARKTRARTNEYSITGGSVIDHGAKLLAAVPANEILASAGAYHAIASYVEAEPFVLGHHRPYRIKSASAISSPIEAAAAKGFTVLCGRETEIAHVLDCYTRAGEGGGQVVTISGEAGIGKSRVLYELKRRLPADGCQIFDAPCHSYGIGIPYYPFLGLLRTYLQLADLPADEAHARVVNTIHGMDSGLQRYLPHYLYLLSIPSTEYLLPKHAVGESMKLALQEALVAVLTVAARERPLVITFEDWHWADDASTAVLEHLIDVAPSFAMLLVVSCRPEFHPSWTTKEHCSWLKLAGVSLTQTKAMLSSITGAAEIPADLLTNLHQRTLGNPFFIEEVCSSLLERGKIHRRDTRLVADEDGELLGLPDSVQAVLRARLDRLDRETQEIVHCAAVIGREFSRKLLEVTCGRVVDPILRGLVEIGILKQIRVVPEAEYMFRHALIQVVAYETLLIKARRKLHGLVGENIIHLYPEGVLERTEILAYHFELSDDVDRAIHFAILAGERALARSAHRDAAKHLKAAEHLVATKEDSPGVARWKMRIALSLGPALVVSEGFGAPGVIRAYLQAREFSQALGATDDEFVALWGLWRYCNSSMVMDDSRRYANQLIDMARKSGRPDQLHSAYAALAGIETFLGNVRPALDAVAGMRANYQKETQYELIARLGASPLLIGLAISANAVVLGGNYGGALAALEEAFVLARELKDPAAEATCLYYASAARLLGGDLEKSNEYNQRLLDLAESARMPQWVASARFQQVRFQAISSGNPVEHLDSLVAAADAAVVLTRSQHTPTRLSLATICVLTGQFARGLLFVEEGLKGLRFFRPEFLRLKARALQQTEPATARACLAEAWALSVEMEARVWQLRILQDRVAWPESGSPRGEQIELLKQTIDQFSSELESPEIRGAKRRLEALLKPA